MRLTDDHTMAELVRHLHRREALLQRVGRRRRKLDGPGLPWIAVVEERWNDSDRTYQGGGSTMAEAINDALVALDETRLREGRPVPPAEPAEPAEPAAAPAAPTGPYTAHKGKLDRDDSRAAYVTGPCLNGRIAPVASFWTLADAERWASQKNAEHKG